MNGDPFCYKSSVSFHFDERLMGSIQILVFCLLCFASSTYGYDPLDPNGNITIKWDVMHDDQNTQVVRVSIFNFQLFRHVEQPGWKLTWNWTGDEVIWDMTGAETTEQGNCSAFKSKQLPHCCDRQPVIVDLLPGAPFNKQVANCCKGGVLSSMTQNPSKYGASFQMTIGSFNASVNGTTGEALTGFPQNFSIGLPGYTCGEPLQVPPSKFIEDRGRRRTQALDTWNITCSYSQFRATPTPTCCVSLSAFYNDTIIPCPKCSCACQGQPTAKCINPGELPPVLQLHHNEEPQPVVRCTPHMCPIRIHWHVMLSYKQYWRVKLTITNLNFVKNYTDWNLVVLHPNLKKVTRVFSFNYKPINQYGALNDTGIFYGIEYYNDMLLQSGKTGNVQTELLLEKDTGWKFSFGEGWAFPRKISFNGEECVIPQPDYYPTLPNSGPFTAIALPLSLIVLIAFLVLYRMT
ncbi:OLC1v1002359C1 [Oldenlandia corymbosa var. corymbosa]|uniref:COBRA-like protein n=1 Tax=Oldenlandia corymbosa var. corymbosa TaxID=529605 RepID=A0AAV1D8M3_OLDCO|nr:OLC1v1002359C1 [Oldenlandia corymbosa var. corymbosa]